MNLVCPSRLDDTNAVAFVNSLRRSENDPDLIIDFRRIGFALPFATLLLAESVRQLFHDRKPKGLPNLAHINTPGVADTDGLSYLKHVGFFQYIGFKAGNPPNAPGLSNSHYIPIKQLKEQELRNDIKGKGIQDAIERQSYNIASMIVEGGSPDSTMLAYCYREIIRNTFEHANIDYCTLMAQRWGAGDVAGDVEIAIIDRGRGILESMREAYDVDSAEQAISLALRPGVSRVKQPRSTEKWANSGFGLYILSQIGLQYGEFVICSSGKMLRLCCEEEGFKDVTFTGTAIKLRVNLNDAEYFPNFLELTGRRGEEEVFKTTGERKSASQKSKVL